MTLTDQFPSLLERDDVKTIAVHEMALLEVSKMFRACEGVANDHGFGSPLHREMVESLHKVLSTLFSMGFSRHAYVTRDGDLSLYVQDGTFVFGIIFHRNRDWDAELPEGHYPPGTWSTHS